MRYRITAVVFCTLLVSACTDDPTRGGREPVASVSVASPTDELAVGGTLQLAAAARDRRNRPLTGRTVTWSSSNDSVATVTPSGLVSGHRAGQATVRATSEGKYGQLVVSVHVLPVASVQITPPLALQLDEGTEMQLGVIVRAADGTVLNGHAVLWASSDETVAEVSPAGVLRAARYGSAHITATVEGVQAVAEAVVHSLVDRIELPFTRATLDVGEVIMVVPIIRGRDGLALNRIVTWTSSAESVATAAGPGRITGVATGTTVLTATSEGRSASLEVEVTPWHRMVLMRVNGETMPATVMIADSAADGSLTLSSFAVQEGMLRRGPGSRYELQVRGLTAAGSRVVESAGEVLYHFLEGYPMFVRDGPNGIDQPPHFRGVVVPPAGEYPLTGALTGVGPEVELTFRMP